MVTLNRRLAALGVALLTACSAAGPSVGDEAAILTAHGYDIEPSFLKHFSDGHDTRWYMANFAYVGPVNRTAWDADNIVFNDDGIELVMLRERTDLLPFTGAEYQRRGRYHHGRYEVVMRPARGSGLVSSFFTHTDNSQGGDPHDEIDIEFLGHRTSEMQVNYFTGGRMAGGVYIQLPYDAADEFQLYAIEWDVDEIRWFVGDQLVHTEDGSRQPLPVTPGRLMMNIWTGSEGQYGWHGRPTFRTGASAGYLCASYVRWDEESGGQCSDTYSFDLPPVDLSASE